MDKPSTPIEWPVMLYANIAILSYSYEHEAFTAAFLGKELCDENDSIVSHDTAFGCSLNFYGTIMELINDDNLVRIPFNGYDIYINPRRFKYTFAPTADVSQLIINARLECDDTVYTKHLVATIGKTPWAIVRKCLRDISLQYDNDTVFVATPGAQFDLRTIPGTLENTTDSDESAPVVPLSVVGATPCSKRRRKNDNKERRTDN